jgi:hypothetical protein
VRELRNNYTRVLAWVAAGHRAFDILHVAHARLVRPRAFLTFESHQVCLAKVVGLTVGP